MLINYRFKSLTAIGIIGILILAGCGRKDAASGQNQEFIPEVAVVTIQPTRLIITTDLTGRTSAKLVAEVRPQVGGIIKKRLFVEGSEVKSGQVLYQIDPAIYQAALDNANAALGRTEANLPAMRLKVGRLRELLADKAVSQQDYDDAAAALKQAEADVDYWKAMVKTAQINLNYTRIVAPIAGRIGISNVTEGALLTAHQPIALATIQRLDPMYVDVAQSTAELLRLRRRLEEGRLQRNGQVNKVRLVLEDDNEYPWEGTLQFRDVTVDPATGSVMLRIVFPNPKGILLPGMFVRAVVEEGVNQKAIMIPQQAVSRDPKGNPIALIADAKGKVQQRILTIDRAIGNQWLVSSGIAPGEQVIVEGIQKVKPGASVRTIPFETVEKNGGERKNASRPTAKSN
jgi:membrane fusion protein (multidrug efflux system)